MLRADTVRTGYVESADGSAHIVREQLVGPVVDTCKELHNAGLHGAKEARHLASIPHVVVEHYCNVQGIDLREFMRNPEHARRMLNAPEFADFRIAPGRV
jgi:hypothetical protein